MNILNIFISAFIHVTTCKRHQPAIIISHSVSNHKLASSS